MAPALPEGWSRVCLTIQRGRPVVIETPAGPVTLALGHGRQLVVLAPGRAPMVRPELLAGTVTRIDLGAAGRLVVRGSVRAGDRRGRAVIECPKDWPVNRRPGLAVPFAEAAR